jgi:hypothetical protein
MSWRNNDSSKRAAKLSIPTADSVDETVVIARF